MSASVILLEGELLKAYEDFVLGKGSLSEQQIAKLKTVTHLPDDFISGLKDERFEKITAVDLSMFVSVVEIGGCFLYKCSALTSADLSALTSLSIIGCWFLLGCSAMTSVTLPSASKITKIESSFLYGCSSLTVINNMGALSNVKSVDYCFLYGCSSLEIVDLRPLSNVKSVGGFFLYNCPKLTKKEYLDQVDLTPLLHLSDNDIQVYEDEGNNNLKVALARVRSGGANGPKFVAPSSSTSSMLVPTAASQSAVVQNEEEENSKNNSSGVEPAPERKNNNSSGVAPGPNSSPPSSSPTAAQAKKAILGANDLIKMSTPPPEARPGLKWYDAKNVKMCMRPGCKKEFGMFTWRNQCHSCGEVFCSDHSEKAVIPGGSSSKEQTVCYGCELILRYNDVPLQLFHLSLLGCYVLTQSDLQKLKLVKKLPDHFLRAKYDDRLSDSRLSKLTHVDLSPLSSVESVGSRFLSAWSNLQSVDLRPLSNVTSVSSYFLLGCSSLQSIDLTPLSNVTSVSHSFLAGCSGLQSIDLKGLSNVTSVDSSFLSYCSGLQSVDLKPLSNVTSVDSNFLYGCSSLQSIDLKGLSNVTSVSSCFLSDCSSLQSIDLKPLSNVTSVSSAFLHGCSKLTKKDYLDQVDLTPLLNIPDSKIKIYDYEDKENNLKKALQRVRAGGANGGPKFVAPSSSATAAASSASNSSGVAPAPKKRDENDEGEETNNSSGVEPAPNSSPASSSSPTAIDDMEAAAGGRTSRFSFEENAATEQQHAFDASFDVLPSNYKPARSASEAYRDVLSLLNNPKMDQNELDAAVAQVQQKANSLAAKAAQQHSLSSDQLFAVLAYTADVRKVPPHRLKEENNAWHFLNRSLGMRSSADFALHSPLLDFLSHIIAGVSKLPSESNIVVWRACKKQLNELSSKGAYSNKGTRLCFPAFSSVSRQGNVSVAFARDQEKQGKNHGSLMAIRASCVYGLKEFSMFPYEDELLMLPNTFVVVDDVQFDVDYNKNLTVKSLGTVALPAKLDVVLLSQTERPVVSSSPSSPSSPTTAASGSSTQKPIQKMDEDELCAFLKTHAVNPKILEVLKQEVVTGLEFMEQNFLVENESLFSEVRKTALEGFRKVHAELSSPSSSGGTGSSAATAASQ